VCLGQRLCNRQAQATAGSAVAARVRTPKVALKDKGKVLRRNAYALINDVQFQGATFFAGP
jgi:hypothetical protein